MGNAAGEGTKAPRIAAIDGDGASTRSSVTVPPVEQQRPAPLPAAGLAASADDGSAAVTSCGEEEDDEEEQVERFYALLANIRALRGLHSAMDGAGSGSGRKRAREAEPPWRPAFRMEDFEEEVGQGTGEERCAVKEQGAGGGAARRAAAGAARARATADDHEEDDAADARERKLGRRVAARG